VALGIEGEEAREDLVAEVGRPEEAALIGMVILVGLVEEDGFGARARCARPLGPRDGRDRPARRLSMLAKPQSPMGEEKFSGSQMARKLGALPHAR
jgi:hypothetical protein